MAEKSNRFRLLLGVSFFWLSLSMLFDGVNTLILPIHLQGFVSETDRATTLGLVTLVGLIFGIFIQPLAGTFSDGLQPRWGRIGLLTLGVLLILASLTFFGSSRSLLTVLVSYLMIQMAANVAQAAQQGFIPDLIPMEWRGTAAGFKGLMDVGGAMIGYVVLGQLLSSGGIRPSLIGIAFILIAGLIITFILVRERPSARVLNSGPSRLANVFVIDLHQNRPFVWLIISRFFFLLGSYGVIRFFLFFIQDRLALNPSQASEVAGNLLAGLALITVISSVPTGWASDRFGRKPLMLVGVAFSTLGVLLLITARSNWQILLFGGIMSVGTAAFSSANWALTTELAPPTEGGRFLGLANSGTAGAVAAAGLFGPIVDGINRVAEGSGYTALFLISGLAFVASAFALRGVFARSDYFVMFGSHPR